MKRLISLSMLLLSVSALHAQTVPQAFNPPLRFVDFRQEIQDSAPPLFDKLELASRQIDTVYIIEHHSPLPGLGYDRRLHVDTVEHYILNRAGAVVQATYNHDSGRLKSSYFVDDTGNPKGWASAKGAGNWPALKDAKLGDSERSYLLAHRKEGGDSIFTETELWRFSDGWDTAVITTRRFDSAGRLHEEKARVKPARIPEVEYHAGDRTYRSRIRYNDIAHSAVEEHFDDLDSLVRRLRWHYLTDTVEVKQYDRHDSLVTQCRRTLRHSGGLLFYTTEGTGVDDEINRELVVLMPLEPGSRLVARRSIIGLGERPSARYQEILYIKNQRALPVKRPPFQN